MEKVHIVNTSVQIILQTSNLLNHMIYINNLECEFDKEEIRQNEIFENLMITPSFKYSSKYEKYLFFIIKKIYLIVLILKRKELFEHFRNKLLDGSINILEKDYDNLTSDEYLDKSNLFKCMYNYITDIGKIIDFNQMKDTIL